MGLADLSEASGSERALLLSAQQARSRAKKVVDRRASKGRKIRYTVMPKLVNFMAPRPTPEDFLTDELFGALFGGNSLKDAPPTASATDAIATSRL